MRWQDAMPSNQPHCVVFCIILLHELLLTSQSVFELHFYTGLRFFITKNVLSQSTWWNRYPMLNSIPFYSAPYLSQLVSPHSIQLHHILSLLHPSYLLYSITDFLLHWREMISHSNFQRLFANHCVQLWLFIRQCCTAPRKTRISLPIPWMHLFRTIASAGSCLSTARKRCIYVP